MADIRCPNCGKNNPADQVLCQFCSTPLKPSGGLPVGASDDLMGLLGDQDDGTDVPDWLRTLRPEGQDSFGSADQGAKAEGELSFEWQQDETQVGQLPDQTQEEVEDEWLSRLGKEPLPDFSIEDKPGDTGEDTLGGQPSDEQAKLDGAGEKPSEASGPTAFEPSGSGFEETLDWLSSLEKEPSPEEAGEAMPDFLASSEAENSLEWLDQIPSQAKEEPDLSATPPALESMDWLSQPVQDEPVGLSSSGDETLQFEVGASAEQEQPAPSDDLSDWLSRLGDQSVGLDEEKEAGAFTPPADEAEPDFSVQSQNQMPADDDWLDSLQSSAVDSSFSPEEPGAPSGDQSDWLSRLGVEGFEPETSPTADLTSPGDSVPAASSEAEPFGEGVSSLADWTREVSPQTPVNETGGEEIPVSPFSFDEESAEIGEDVPVDWFTEPAQPAQQPAVEDELPDWLRQAGESESPFGARKAPEGASPDWLRGSFEAETPSGESSRVSDEETPDWLGQFGEPASQAEAAPMPDSAPEEANFAALNLDEGVVPDWLTKLDMNAAPSSEGSSVPAFVLDEETSPFEVDESLEEAVPAGEFAQAPDWLSQISEEQALPPMGERPAQEVDTGLARAELPGWLEAMRPSEGEGSGTMFQDKSDSRVESAGLLAGVPGILPAEKEASRMRKPPVYSIKLHVAQEQQDRVDMLKELLADEERTPVMAAPAGLTTVYILRLLILGAFILGAIFAIWTGLQTPTPGPGSIPQEVLDLRMALDNLTNGAPVLVAFDYEPSSAPEMEAAAMGVIDQLVVKGSVIRAVSTTSSGPALAKRMLGEALNMPDRNQSTLLDIAILGYIPGGAAGLQAFGRDPAGLLGYNLESTDSSKMNAWAEPIFNPAKGLANFQLVLVITDNADTARSWVEQTGQHLQRVNIPLLMVVSTQAEPMVRPYYDTNPRQVAGMATGVMGGVFMESLNGRDGIARGYMDAYSLTLMVAVLLLVVGSLVNLVSGQLAFNKQLKGEGKA